MSTFRVDDVVFILSLNGDKYEIVVRDELEKVCYKRTFDFDDKIFEGHEFIRNAWILNHVLCEGFNLGDYVNVDNLECSEENNVKKFIITVNAIIPPGNDSITIDIPCWIDDIEQFAKLYDSIEDSDLVDKHSENEYSEADDSSETHAHTIENIYKKLHEIQNDILAIQLRQEAHDKLVDSVAYLEQEVSYIRSELHDHQLDEQQRRNPYY